MKRILLLVLLGWGTAMGAYAQQVDEGIQFFQGSVEELFARATEEGKPIYVDVMASWCGPCKWMARNVFTKKKVADYYNSHFINYRIDIQKGEGPEFGNRYRISLLPTHLYLYPDGTEFSRYLGAMSASEFYLFGTGIIEDIGPIEPRQVTGSEGESHN